MIDLDKRFPWREKAVRNAPFRIGGLTIVAEPEKEGGLRLISMADGTLLLPQPAGWEFRPSGVFRGYVEMLEGLLLLELDSFEDAEAAGGGERLLDYLGADFRGHPTLTPASALANIEVSLPMRGEGDMVWARLETLGQSHVRKLTARYSCPAERDADFRQWLAENIGQWLRLGSFDDEPTVLDRNASTPDLERVNFQDTLLLRVPRGWTVSADSEDEAGRILYAVDSPDAPETLWLQSALFPVGEEGEDVPEGKLHAFALLLSQGKFRASEGWNAPALDRLADGDLVAYSERLEESDDGALRRATWYRFALRDHLVVTAAIELCTNAEHLDTAAERRTRALVDREVRLASIWRWRPRWEPAVAASP